MPGVYQNGDYDLAGFAVGIVEKRDIIDGSRVGAGDVILGLASSGPHANGYSLIRKILATTQTALHDVLSLRRAVARLACWRSNFWRTVASADAHLRACLACIARGDAGARHGPYYWRVVCQKIYRASYHRAIRLLSIPKSWSRPAIFDCLQQRGNIADDEMLRTFNCGIGMVVVVSRDCAAEASAVLARSGERVQQIGYIERGAPGSQSAVSFLPPCRGE